MVLPHRFLKWRQMQVCITAQTNIGECEGHAQMCVGVSLFI